MSAVIVGVGILAVGTIMQASAASDAADAQKASQAAQQKRASADAAKARYKAMADARKLIGTTQNQAGTSGMGQASSGVAGSISVIGSQTGANIGHLNVQEGFAEMASVANQQAADAQASAMQWQAIGNIGSTIFSMGMNRMPKA